MQELTNNQQEKPVATVSTAGKKPSGSVRTWSIEDVKQALRRRLLAAEQEPDPEKRADILQKAWPLVRTIRRHGWSSPWAAAFAFGSVAVAAVLIYLCRPTDLLYCEIGCLPSTQVRVIEQYSNTDFMLQRVVDGVPQQPEVRRFCESVPLEIGFTLTKLQVQDVGDCWTTTPFRLPYVIRRYDGQIFPTLPPNCHQDPANLIHGRVSCNGRPNFN